MFSSVSSSVEKTTANGIDLINISTTEGTNHDYLRRGTRLLTFYWVGSTAQTHCALGVLPGWTSGDSVPAAIGPFTPCCIGAFGIHALTPVRALRVIDVILEAHCEARILFGQDNPPGNLISLCLRKPEKCEWRFQQSPERGSYMRCEQRDMAKQHINQRISSFTLTSGAFIVALFDSTSVFVISMPFGEERKFPLPWRWPDKG